MPRVAILPVFTVKPGHVDAFVARARQQRRDCLAHEPGCEQFDVLRGEDPAKVTLYEIYTDRDALAAHRETPHLADFRATVEPWVESTTIETFELDE